MDSALRSGVKRALAPERLLTEAAGVCPGTIVRVLGIVPVIVVVGVTGVDETGVDGAAVVVPVIGVVVMSPSAVVDDNGADVLLTLIYSAKTHASVLSASRICNHWLSALRPVIVMTSPPPSKATGCPVVVGTERALRPAVILTVPVMISATGGVVGCVTTTGDVTGVVGVPVVVKPGVPPSALVLVSVSPAVGAIAMAPVTTVETSSGGRFKATRR